MTALDLAGLDRFRASDLLAEAPGAPGAPLEVDLALVDFDPLQPRRAGLRDADLAELADSIRAQGVLEPVSLRSHPREPGRYMVNRGERRVRASRLAGRRTVPAFVDERVDRFAQAVENLQREDLTPFDVATFIAEREAEGCRRAEIARRLHKPASFITEAASLLDAPAEVRAAFDAGRIRDTRALYQLARMLRDDRAAAGPLLAGDGPITREALEAAAAAGTAPPLPAAAAPLPPAPSAALPAPARSPRRAGARPAALRVEHAGRRGRLARAQPADPQTGEVEFDDGSRAVVRLAELTLVEWTGGWR